MGITVSPTINVEWYKNYGKDWSPININARSAIALELDRLREGNTYVDGVGNVYRKTT